jgi:hypothetical protein
VLERFQPLLVQGGMLVDEADDGPAPRLLVYLEHAIRDGRTGRSGEPRAISQRLQFILLKEDGTAVDGGPAPYLDCRPITAEERALVADAITAPWLSGVARTRPIGPQSQVQKVAETTTETRESPVLWPKAKGSTTCPRLLARWTRAPRNHGALSVVAALFR